MLQRRRRILAGAVAMNLSLRAPCPCGSDIGRVDTRNGQDCVWCVRCDKYQYNAPRLETGREQRSVATRPGLTPARRARIFQAHDYRCVDCGRGSPDIELHVEHIIPRAAAARDGLLDELIDSDVNLAPICAECNLGNAWVVSTPSVRLMYRVLQMKAKTAP